MNRDSLAQYRQFYRQHLLDQIVDFWLPRCLDREHGGYLHYFNRQGNVTATDKSTWCTGRMTYFFSMLCNEVEHRAHWLDAARIGRDFLVRHVHAGGGRWHYLVGRDGKILNSSRSVFSDIFVLMGLAQYATASGSRDDLDLIEQTYAAIETNVLKPGFNEYHHFDLAPQYDWHGPTMAVLGLIEYVRPVLGDPRVKPLADWALDRVLNRFMVDEHQMLFELLDHNGRVVPNGKGLITNPGHALESAWFAMSEAVRRDDDKAVQRAATLCRWAYDKGWDHEQGGLFAFVDPAGNPPPGSEVVSWNDRWDDKLWWVHSEALYAMLLAATTTGDADLYERFERLHQWTFAHFPDADFGEWHMTLHRDGSPNKSTKGNVFRSAFHVGRDLIKLQRLEATP